METIVLKDFSPWSVTAPYFLKLGKGCELAKVVLSTQKAINTSPEPHSVLCVSFAGVEAVSITFLNGFLEPILASNLGDRSTCKIIFKNLEPAVKEEICGYIALYLMRKKPKEKDYGIVILEGDTLQFLGNMSKAIKPSWAYLQAHSDQQHSARSLAESRAKSRSSSARHLKILKRLGLLQQRKRRKESMMYWICFSGGAPSIWEDVPHWEEVHFSDADIADLSGFAEINARLSSAS